MSGPGEMTKTQPNAALWEGLQQFGTLTDWLAAARNWDGICEILAHQVAEFASGGWTLERCEIGHMRFKADYWSGTYDLFVRKPEEAETQVIPLQGTIYPPGYLVSVSSPTDTGLGTPEWRLFLPELNLLLTTPAPETVLDALAVLTDPVEACPLLEQMIRESSPAYRDFTVLSCIPNVVRYKPGSRCTILYSMEYPQELARGKNWPDLVVAKTYRNNKGQNAYESMRALWDSPLGRGDIVTVAEPLGYSPERRVLIQGPIREEMTLKKLIDKAFFDEAPENFALLDDYMRKTAAGLAALHRSGVTTGRSWTWEDELDEVRDRIERLGASIPSLAHAADPLLEKLQQMASSTPADQPVPSHGSYRPAQVLLYQGQIGFIDFDSFCQAEPAHDLALFLSTVVSIGLDTTEIEDNKRALPLEEPERTARLKRMVEICDSFVEEYERHAPVSRQRIALWEALDLMMLVLASWIKVKTFRLQDCIFLLEYQLRSMGI